MLKRSSANWHAAHKYRQRTCTYKGCTSSHKAHGLCAKHSAQLRRGRIKCDAMSIADKVPLPRLTVWPCAVCGAPKYYTRCINSLCGVMQYE